MNKDKGEYRRFELNNLQLNDIKSDKLKVQKHSVKLTRV